MAETLEAKPFVHPRCTCDEKGSTNEAIQSLNNMQAVADVVSSISNVVNMTGGCTRDAVLVGIGAGCWFAASDFKDRKEARAEVDAAVEFYFEQLAVMDKTDPRMHTAKRSDKESN